MQEVEKKPTLEQLPNLVVDLKNEVQEMKALLIQKAEPQEEPDNPLSIKEVSELLGLSVQTIYGYCQRKELKHYKRGNRLFFLKTDILIWVRSGEQKTLLELEADAEGYLSKRKSNQLKLF